MKKILKFLGYTLLSLVGLLVVLIIILKLIPDDQYKSWVTSAVTSATGREFHMDTLELDFASPLRIATDNVRLANPDWASDSDMIAVNHLEAELAIWPLFSGRAEVRGILDTADILSRSNAEGVSNWSFAQGASQEEEIETEDANDAGGGLPIRPVIRELRLDNITLSIVNDAENSSRQASLDHLLIETPEQETTLTLNATANDTVLQLAGSLGDIDLALDQAPTAMELKGTIAENTFGISGQWGPVLPQATLDLLFNLKVPSTSAVAALAGYEIGDFGVMEMSARTRIADGVISIDDIVTTLDGEQTHTSIKGDISNVVLLGGVNIAVEMNTESLQRIVDLFNIELPVPLPPEINLSAMIQGDKEGLNINDIDIEIRDEGTEIKLNAEVKDILKSRQVVGDVRASIDSVSRLSKYANMELPALGAIELAGHVQSSEATYQLQNLDAQLSADNLNLKITGGVDDLVGVAGIDAIVDLVIDSLSEQNIAELEKLLKSFDVELPSELLPQSARINTRINGSLEQLGLADLDAEVIDQGLKVSATANIENVLKPSGVDANVVLNSESVATFSKYAGTELPALGPLEANAKIVSAGDSYRLDKLEANLVGEPLKARVIASVDDLIKLSGIQAEINADTATLAALSDLAQTELPDTDPVNVLATLAADSLEKADVTVKATSGRARLAANSTLSLKEIANDLALDISVQAENLTDLNKLAQQELPDEGPLDLSASVRVKPRNLSLDNLKLMIANDQSVTGNLMLQQPDPEDPQGKTMLQGELDIPYLDLTPLFPEPVAAEEDVANLDTEEEAVEEVPGAATETVEEEKLSDEPLDESDRLLSSEPIISTQLNLYDVDLTLNAAKLDIGKANIRDVAFAVELHDGRLNIAPIQASGSSTESDLEGNLDGYLLLEADSAVPTLRTEITLTQFPMPMLGGALDLHIDVSGQGRSVAELMASMDGQVLLSLTDGEIDRSFVSRFGKGLFSTSGGSDKTAIECAILRVDIEDGVADFEKKLAAQLTEVTWHGGGTVDFNTERLKADIAPKPRKGVPISVGGSLAGLVKLTGTLKHPSVAPDYSDMAIKYGKYSAYVATGGLSLLAEVVAKKLGSNQDVCGQILDGTVFGDDDAQKTHPPR